jgi:RNA-directed DNA polymerase
LLPPAWLVDDVSDAELTFAEDWREQIRLKGKRAFENEEMIRLGFVSDEALARLTESGVSKEQYAQARADLATAIQDLKQIERELADLQDVEKAVAEIRSRRIERVKAQAAVRRAEKAVAREERRAQVAEKRRVAPTFLGRSVSNRLTFTGGDAEMLARRHLPSLETFTDLAQALSLAPERLQWLTYERSASTIDHYVRFEIPKRTGGTRLISSPKPALRATQEWIRSGILAHLHPHAAAMAFRPGTSIVDNALLHADADIVVRIDLKDFFPSISFPRVRGYFASLGYNPGISSVLGLLCTDAPRVRLTHGSATHVVAVGERGLPQGACTSPELANLIAGKLDRRLAGLAAHSEWTYSRYADDLVFSTSADAASPHRLIRAVSTIIDDEGFVINSEKTRVMRSPNRQMVTGLVVNDGVRLSRRDVRRIRSFLHHCETEGLDAVSARLGKDARAMALGYVAYVHMVSPDVADRLRRQHSWI